MRNSDRASRLFTSAFASASGTIAHAYHGNTSPRPHKRILENKLDDPRPEHRQPQRAARGQDAGARNTRPSKLLFSDRAALWTIFGNITVASGSTSHSSARDSVPAPM